MPVNQAIHFKDPLYTTISLETALKREKEKYEKCPAVPDMVPGYVDALAWGYVVIGYFLAEQSFKALLYLREEEVLKEHSLSILFDSFVENDQAILREYYTDYQATIGGPRGEFRFKSLDAFLLNLDGGARDRAKAHSPGDTTSLKRFRRCHSSASIICTKLCSDVSASSNMRESAVSNRLYTLVAGACTANPRENTSPGWVPGGSLPGGMTLAIDWKSCVDQTIAGVMTYAGSRAVQRHLFFPRFRKRADCRFMTRRRRLRPLMPKRGR